jgi:hypothetical protein
MIAFTRACTAPLGRVDGPCRCRPSRSSCAASLSLDAPPCRNCRSPSPAIAPAAVSRATQMLSDHDWWYARSTVCKIACMASSASCTCIHCKHAVAHLCQMLGEVCGSHRQTCGACLLQRRPALQHSGCAARQMRGLASPAIGRAAGHSLAPVPCSVRPALLYTACRAPQMHASAFQETGVALGLRHAPALRQANAAAGGSPQVCARGRAR